ncbi:putative RNA helicase aquarius [Blattamonas nauphoetae]|uniref:RNA helicase aquarius n=1 Tax=Blattamonas nauphoetae TaxID=2049346 RepID=A0ABQ9XGJ0_9EUKA|nr:putative RNA helicase aquarius [Blattamonas nauphoetae]
MLLRHNLSSPIDVPPRARLRPPKAITPLSPHARLTSPQLHPLPLRIHHAIREDLEGITVVPPPEQADTDSLTFRELFGVHAVRGAEVIGVEDEDGNPSVYQTFNLVVRRNPKENNAKAVLDSIRTMIVDGVFVPAWLGDVLIGYGDPEQCIPANQPPLSRGEERAMLAERERIADELSGSQLDAVSSGLKHGLTLIDGAPGTGKTRVLVLALSNSALNELFEAAPSLAGQPRYFVRIGHGSETLKLNHSFSKEARVDNMLLRRLRCLELVKALAESLGGPGEAVSQSCETAEYFFDNAVNNVWESFEQLWEERKENLDVAAEFPFNAFFEGAGKSLVDGVLEKEEAEEEAMQKDKDNFQSWLNKASRSTTCSFSTYFGIV